MPDVTIQVRTTAEGLTMLPQLTRAAVERAIGITISHLRELAKQYTPEDTGRLLSSFQISHTPSSIVMKWDAVSPQGFQYARVADIGRPGGAEIAAKTPRGLIWRDRLTGQWHRAKRVTQGAMRGRFFSEAMRFEARDILKEELKRELELMLAP